MKDKRRKTTSQIFTDGRAIDAALRRDAREAARLHKQAGVPLVVWENGRTVLVPPAQIKVGRQRSGKRRRGGND